MKYINLFAKGIVPSLLFFFLVADAECKIIQPTDQFPKEWQNPLAYNPAPVYLLHGLGKCEPSDWNTTIKDMFLIDLERDDRGLFDQYKERDVNRDLLTYVHAINFHPSTEETRNMIERNSSIDTFQTGDTYVEEGLKLDSSDVRVQLASGDHGWADRFNDFIKGHYAGESDQSLANIDRYEAGKGILVGHSMGGLVAREFLTNVKYSDENPKIKKLVTIGTPHTGTFLSNTARAIHATRAISMFALGMTGVLSPVNATLADYAVQKQFIDINGDALRDMEVGSEFLETLNYDRDQRSDEIGYSLIASYVGRFDYDDGMQAQFLVGGDDEVLGGDGVVSLRSQRARDPRNIERCLFADPEETIIYASHSESRRIASLPQKAGECAPLLKMITGIPALDVVPYYDPLFIGTSIPVYMTMTGEYFPGQCTVSIFDKQESGTYQTRYFEDLPDRVFPDDLWNNDALDPVVASLMEYVYPNGTMTETKFEVKNIADKQGVLSVIVLEAVNRAFLKKERFQTISKDTVVTDAYINNFWSGVLSAPVTGGYPRYGDRYTSVPYPNGYRGAYIFTPLYYDSIDPMAMKHLAYSKRVDAEGDIRGSLCRGYISFDTDMISSEAKYAINQEPDKVKILLGFYGALHADVPFATDKALIKRATFDPNINVSAWGAGRAIVGTMSFDESQGGGLLDINDEGALRIFKEIELPFEMLDINGKTQFEMMFDTENSPRLRQCSSTSESGENVFYMSLKDIRFGAYHLSEAPFSPYLKICY